jgi:hypothetical protein
MRFGIAASLVLILAACGPSNKADQQAVQAVLHGLYDRPGAVLETGPVVVEDDIAVADWTQGRMGGRALLRRGDKGWRLTLCSGDALRSKAGLMELGVPQAQAEALERQLHAAEAKVAPERLKMMAAFRGVMRTEERP